MTAIKYARGSSRYDAYPAIRVVPDFAAFERDVLADRARAKGLQYVCAPFRVNGDSKAHRSKDAVEPRRFLALDIDHVAGAEVFSNLRLWLTRFSGFGFTTASSTPDAPRARVILELDRDVDRAEGIRLGAAIQRDIGEEFGNTVKLDRSTHRGEQPCFGPVVESEAFHLDGDPVRVDEQLRTAPETEPERKGSAAVAPDDDPVIGKLKELEMYRRDLGAGRHSIRCPWVSDHTTEDDAQSTATCYMQPHYAGYVTAGFKCLHEHCAGRKGDDLLEFLGLSWREVRDSYEAEDKTVTTARPKAPVQEIDGAAILDNVYAFLSRFVAYPSEHARVAHTLWVAHTHMMDRWESTPRIAFLSPEPGSGKTRALEITETLVPRPVEAINATPAYLFRKVSDPDGLPTILFDEIDTLFGPRAKENEEVRGILNAGHRRGAMAGRCVTRGKIIETEELPAYCAVALAGLGALPDTILSRSVIVRMRRRAPRELVEPYRRRIHATEGNVIRDHLTAWAESINLADAWPEMPEGIEDRNADVWEALLAIADVAGGDWPQRARVSAVSLVSDAKAANPSLGVRLLADLRTVFGDREAMFTTDIVSALVEIDESPWADMRGKPIDARHLSRYLSPYGVRRKQVRIAEKSGKGYAREDLHDPWLRYLGEATKESETSETSATSGTDGDCPRCAGEGCGWCRQVKVTV